ncbi:DUF559 domain-containing protein [Agromyces tropicus]|uniref:DUF559 domain-containing protein n=1 Tax=Agromyces tropicus TaxID=555371 RepID=A0ABP5FSL2_9MICO
MPRANPLPSELSTRPFTVREALDAGVGPDRLRRGDLVAPFHGGRAPAAVRLGLDGRCRLALALAPPSAFVCGATAASVHGIPLPPRLAFRQDVELAVPAPGRAIRRAGVIGRVLRIEAPDLERVRRMSVTTPIRTWCDLGVLLHVPELVAAGDWLLRRGLATASELERAADRRLDRRGVVGIRTALPLLDGRAESPKESELRAILHLAGLPAPDVNVDVVDPHGRFVARVDLLFAAYREVLEYQGDHHRTDRAQWRRDRTREAELESLGYHVTEVTDDDLADPVAMVARLARRLGGAGWTGSPRSLDGIRRRRRR